MAQMPTGGAGGFASGGAGNQSGAPAGAGATGDPRAALGAQNDPSGSGADAAPEAQTAPALGAGGTSAAAPGNDAAHSPVGTGSRGGAKAAGAAAAVPAAAAGGQMMILAMFINYLKGIMMTMAAVAANFWGLVVGLGLAAGKAVVGAVMGFGTMVSSAVGGVFSAAASGVTSVVSGLAAGALVVVSVVTGVTSDGDLALKDGSTIDCGVSATTALEKIEGSDANVDSLTLTNAKTIFGVLSAWGMPDENVAGIVGNWDAESGVDPTSVQSYFNSPQVMSDEKKAAATNTDNGIGLGQWTFGRNANLRTYAESNATNWWTLEMQLGFMVSDAEGSDALVVKDMISTTRGTPAEAASHFHDEWERSADTDSMAARRGEKAAKWMGLFSGWEQNQALADSILAQAGTTVSDANGSRAEAVRSDCLGVGQASLTMDEGGLTLEEATQLMEVYKAEGENFLQSRYGAGGPGDCGYGKADNCVGFSTYFANKFTSFQVYARGNGIDTAGSMATMMGKELTKTPKVYSVASGPGSGSAGHTFVVLGIEGDQAVIGEAACGTNHRGTRARLMPLSELTNGVWSFVDVSDLMVAEPAAA